MAELDYDKSFEPHDRGSILVIAVYEAFLAIVARRTEDLIQLATGGSGVLPAGALHPGLVDRLADETCKDRRADAAPCASVRSTIARRSTSPSANICGR